MHRKELLGYIDLDTRQWTDGVLTVCSLNVTLEPPGTPFPNIDAPNIIVSF